jgi:hypothetical protein
MDMRKIMTDLEINTIWVGVYKSLTMDVFVDDQERSLITATDNDTIDHSALNAFFLRGNPGRNFEKDRH